MSNWLLPETPFTSFAEYHAAGGGEALELARERGNEWVLDTLERSGLRGRGGAGFPIARKWRSILEGGARLGDRYAVANGAEGEPGTFKDRPLMRANPYQVIEGLAIACLVVNAREAFLGVKSSFAPEIEALERALKEMAAAGALCEAPITLIGGPEDYLFGEETGLLEVIEGNDALPRWLPPYQHGLFATTPQEGWSASSRQIENADRVGSNPTLANNVETLANVPLILRNGADWYRSIGTAETPGPMICTVVGDVQHAGYAEIEPGVPLHEVIDRIGGGTRDGRTVKAVLSGVANPVLTQADLDAPVSYEGLAAVGSAIGAGGFIVYDDSRSMLAVARMVSTFLYVESCGQCRSCKFGCGEITRRLDHIARTGGTDTDFEVIHERLRGVTSQTRCFLAEQEQRVISSLLQKFPVDFAAEAPSGDEVEVPKILEITDGVATCGWKRPQ
jgi:NADH-quinone oxidoreductase subunit F